LVGLGGFYKPMGIIVSIKDLADTKYGRAVCYPHYIHDALMKRIGEMRMLGVRALCFHGSKIVAGVSVLGKGCVGIVVSAILEGDSMAALKIARTDAEPSRLIHEAKMLQIANSVNVGPRLLGYTDNLLMTEYIDGLLLPKWVEGLSGDGGSVSSRLGAVLRDILEQCWRLDSIGLDHGELSWADKHIIVDKGDKPHILDFETASDRRKVANVTSVSQYLFVKSRVAETIVKKFRRIDAERLIETLREYKAEHTREKFENLLKVLGLTS